MWDEEGASFSQETSDDGPCQKMFSSFGAMCVGFLLFPISLFLVGWNEQRYVCDDNDILYAQANAKDVGCSSQGISDEFVFFSCPVQQSSLQSFTPCMFNKDHGMDCDAGIGNAFSFQSIGGSQTAEIYQCQETTSTKKQKNNLGQNVEVTTYTYKPIWSTQHIDSSSFERQDLAQQGCPGYNGQNPGFPTNVDPATSTDYAPTVKVGDASAPFTISQNLIQGGKLAPDAAVSLSAIPHASITGSQMSSPSQRPLTLSLTNTAVSGNYLVTCQGAPQIGCVRLSYKKTSSTSPSVIANAKSGGITSGQQVPGGWMCSAGEYSAIMANQLDFDGMIQALNDENSTITWVLRILGVCLAWLSVCMMFAPIAAVAEIAGQCANMCPCGGFVADMLSAVAGWIICILSAGIGCSCAFFVMATAWVVMRPLVGGGLMLAACCCCGGGIGLFMMLRGGGNKNRELISSDGDE